MENIATETKQEAGTPTEIPEETTNTVSDTSEKTVTKQSETEEKQEKTFTQQELDTIIQRRLAEEKRKSEERQLMSLTDRESELAKREQEMLKKELKNIAVEQLGSRNIPVVLADVLEYSTEEEMMLKINTMEVAFSQAVQSGVEARFKQNGYTPKLSSAGVSSGEFSDDPFTMGLNAKKL